MTTTTDTIKSLTRFIYCYFCIITGLPEYTGSAWDVEFRDKRHCRDNEIPFDREIASRGRDSFRLETVDSVTANTKSEVLTLAVQLENQWMDKLQTFQPESGRGYNFMRAFVVFDDEAAYQGWKDAQAAGAARNAADPEWKAAHAAGAARGASRPEWKAAHAARLAKMHADPEWQKNHAIALVKTHAAPEWKAAHAAGIARNAADPEWQKNHAAAMAKMHADPEYKASQAASLAKTHADPEWRAAHIAGLAKMHADPKWQASHAKATAITNCQRWNINRNKPCTCGRHTTPVPSQEAVAA
jgi:hypothetical protein